MVGHISIADGSVRGKIRPDFARPAEIRADARGRRLWDRERHLAVVKSEQKEGVCADGRCYPRLVEVGAKDVVLQSELRIDERRRQIILINQPAIGIEARLSQVTLNFCLL